MHSKNIDMCVKNPQSARRKPNYHIECGKNCHKILSVQSENKRMIQRTNKWTDEDICIQVNVHETKI